MIRLKKLIPAFNNLSESDYVQASSLIEKGSALDRRSLKVTRRSMANRRKAVISTIIDYEQRVSIERRTSIERRCIEKLESTESTNDCCTNKLDLNEVENVIEEQNSIISDLIQLSLSAEVMNFPALDRRIQKLSSDIKSHLSKEGELLHRYLETAVEPNMKINALLIKLNLYLQNSANEVLQILEKYNRTKVNAANVKSFLLDMDNAVEIFNRNLKHKNEHLYNHYRAFFSTK